jgi:hypothetical protein
MDSVRLRKLPVLEVKNAGLAEIEKRRDAFPLISKIPIFELVIDGV